MYDKVPLLYWAKINYNALNSKNILNQKNIFNYTTLRHIYVDEMDIFNLDIGQVNILCLVKMSVRFLFNIRYHLKIIHVHISFVIINQDLQQIMVN